ncbi:MAG: ankyrin repeat domain-containing protein [Helicobacteraceae bacterium]|jgi:ankyrin repeat protein|nr:ankyrin repeat domain-containing protein [Helicobacteraceae bacterium]
MKNKKQESLKRNTGAIEAQPFNYTDLLKVLLANDVDAFEIFIKNNGLNCIEKRGKTNLLMNCILENNNEFSKKLIKLGIDLNYQDIKGYSALHYAVQENNLEVVTSLIQNKADVDIFDSYGNTPLWKAAYDGKNKEIIEKLIKAGADIHKKNNSGVTPDELLKEDS